MQDDTAQAGQFRLDGRVALVTGAGGTLGRAQAVALAQAGADLALLDLGDGHRDAEVGYRLSQGRELEATATAVNQIGRRAILLTGDVRSQEDLETAVTSAIKQLGAIDILVANAGINRQGLAWEYSRDTWDAILDTNLTGAWQSCKAVIPHMRARRFGRLILITSGALFMAIREAGAYSAAKAGVAALSRVLAAELGDCGITVNTVAPSTVPSNINRAQAALKGIDYESLIGGLGRSHQLMPVLLEPRDVAHAVVFLASTEARFVTGICLPVDAGLSAF